MNSHQAIAKFKSITCIQPEIDVVSSMVKKKPIVDIMDLDVKCMSKYIEYTNDMSLEDFLSKHLPDALPLVKIMCDIT